MDKDTGERPAPHGGLRGAGGAGGKCVSRVPVKPRNSTFSGHPWQAATNVGGPDDKEEAVGRAFGSCKFQLLSKLVNWMLCMTQGTCASPSTKFTRLLEHPEKWVWLAFPAL